MCACVQIIHRDLKMENILMRGQKGDRVAKIAGGCLAPAPHLPCPSCDPPASLATACSASLATAYCLTCYGLLPC